MLDEKIIRECYRTALLEYAKYKQDPITEPLAHLYRGKVWTYAEVLEIKSSQAEMDMQDAVAERRLAAS